MANDDDRVSLKPLKPTQALKALLSVDPKASDEPRQCAERWQGKQCTLTAGHSGPCRYQPPGSDG